MGPNPRWVTYRLSSTFSWCVSRASICSLAFGPWLGDAFIHGFDRHRHQWESAGSVVENMNMPESAPCFCPRAPSLVSPAMPSASHQDPWPLHFWLEQHQLQRACANEVTEHFCAQTTILAKKVATNRSVLKASADASLLTDDFSDLLPMRLDAAHL